MPDPITGAIAGSAVIGAGASLFGANKQAKAAKKAAKEQAKAAQAAIAAQERALERQIGLQEPFRQFGQNALANYGQAAAYTPFSMAQFQEDPGYKFRMSEGLKALERSAAARGLLQSGGTLKDITRFGQDAASQEYQNAFERYLRERDAKLRPMEYQIGIGQNAASGQGANIGSTANNVSELTQAKGNVTAAGIMGQANAFNAGLTGAANAVSQGIGAYGDYRAAQPYQNYLRSITPTA